MDNSTLLIIATILVVMILYVSYNGSTKEGMSAMSGAPLNYATFDPRINYGKCNAGVRETDECSVGNCPLGTTVSNDRYCGIQCAQELDKADRQKCHVQCMQMMESCN
jgi:hypothetical protein